MRPAGACACAALHSGCDPETCAQAAHSKADATVLLGAVRASAQRDGCPTCGAAAAALLGVPEVEAAWRASVAAALRSGRDNVFRDASGDDSRLRVSFDTAGGSLSKRRYLRTQASSQSSDWVNFNVWREGSEGGGGDGANASCRAIRNLSFHPVRQTGSQESLAHLWDWLRLCGEGHDCLPKEKPILPDRVLQVSDGRIRVLQTNGQRAHYATLSHRWGAQENFTLTKANQEAMTSEIAWDSLPKTYQDAVGLIRELPLDYIWIDTLCILQDDLEDWQRQSVKMRDIYGKSFLSIAASWALDSEGGLFADSELPGRFPKHEVPGFPGVFVRQQPVRTHDAYGSNYHANDSPMTLMRRGWVLQERLLAPRVIYYDAGELKWECNRAVDCQCGGMVALTNFKLAHVSCVLRGETYLPIQWMRVTEKYSALLLTYDQDRGVALAGIAEQALCTGKGGRYLAGLWERSLEHQLCWRIVDNHRKPGAYLAPSWSWLSVFGKVMYGNRMDFGCAASRVDVEINEVECTYARGSTEVGQAVGGFLRCTGRVAKVTAILVSAGNANSPPVYRFAPVGHVKQKVTVHSDPGDGGAPQVRESAWEEVKIDPKLHVRMDYAMKLQEAEDVKDLLILFWGHMWPDESTFMVLKEAPSDGTKFERFGRFHLSRKTQKKTFDDLLSHCSTRKEVVII